VSVSKLCKSRAETPPIVSESGRTRRGRVETAMLHGKRTVRQRERNGFTRSSMTGID
jgi:hypothetical protein